MQKISRREASVILGREAAIFGFIGAGICLWRRAWLLAGALICWGIWDAQRKKFRCHSCRSRLPYFLYEQSAGGTVYCPECGAELELTQSPKFSLPIPKKRSPVIMAGWLLLIGRCGDMSGRRRRRLPSGTAPGRWARVQLIGAVWRFWPFI